MFIMWIRYTEDGIPSLLNLDNVSNIDVLDSEIVFTSPEGGQENTLTFKDSRSAKSAFDKIVYGIENSDKIIILQDKFGSD